MTGYDKLIGTYSARVSNTSNVILKNASHKFTLTPETLRAFVNWLHNSYGGEWVPEELVISRREEQ